jgi:hypothetical protein
VFPSLQHVFVSLFGVGVIRCKRSSFGVCFRCCEVLKVMDGEVIVKTEGARDVLLYRKTHEQSLCAYEKIRTIKKKIKQLLETQEVIIKYKSQMLTVTDLQLLVDSLEKERLVLLKEETAKYVSVKAEKLEEVAKAVKDESAIPVAAVIAPAHVPAADVPAADVSAAVAAVASKAVTRKRNHLEVEGIVMYEGRPPPRSSSYSGALGMVKKRNKMFNDCIKLGMMNNESGGRFRGDVDRKNCLDVPTGACLDMDFVEFDQTIYADVIECQKRFVFFKKHIGVYLDYEVSRFNLLGRFIVRFALGNIYYGYVALVDVEANTCSVIFDDQEQHDLTIDDALLSVMRSECVTSDRFIRLQNAIEDTVINAVGEEVLVALIEVNEMK